MKIRTDEGEIELLQVAENGKRKQFIASAPNGVKGRLDIVINGTRVARKDYDADKQADKDKVKIDTSVEVDFDPEADWLEFRWYRGY